MRRARLGRSCSFRKSIDTYSVAGPWMVTADEISLIRAITCAVSLSVNGEVRQASNSELMIVGIQRQIAWASEWYTLYPGDIIMSGTPEGVSRVSAGRRHALRNRKDRRDGRED